MRVVWFAVVGLDVGGRYEVGVTVNTMLEDTGVDSGERRMQSDRECQNRCEIAEDTAQLGIAGRMGAGCRRGGR